MCIGATGLVGRQLVAELCKDDAFHVIHTLARRPIPFGELPGSSKIKSYVINFDELAKTRWPVCQIFYCCLGTTIRAAGSQTAFRRINRDYVVDAACCARQSGAKRLVVVSAMGANPRSRVFYNRIKGEMEAAVSTLGFDAVIIVRPSLLAGERAEHRTGERFAMSVLKFAPILLPQKYRLISAVDVARAMADAAKEEVSGLEIIESDRLQSFS